jgi:DNA-binding NarL/FixJ family response regulator
MPGGRCVAERLRVLIGDDNPAMLETIRHMLQGEFHVVAAVERARDVVDQVSKLQPDVVVLDIAMGEMNGFEITRQLRLDLCRSKIIFLTVHEELEFIRAALDAGASGYVFKSRMNPDLRTAMKTVLNDKVFIPEAPISQYGLDSTV